MQPMFRDLRSRLILMIQVQRNTFISVWFHLFEWLFPLHGLALLSLRFLSASKILFALINNFLLISPPGWLDDSYLIQRQNYRSRHNEAEDIWKNPSGQHAFTTGRSKGYANYGKNKRPKGPSQTLKVSDKLSSIQLIQTVHQCLPHFSNPANWT